MRELMMRVVTMAALVVAAAGAAAAASNGLVVARSASPCLNLRAAATPSGRVLDCFAPGTRLTQLAASGDWTEVRSAEGGSGWVATAYLAAADPRPEQSAGGTEPRLQDTIAPHFPPLLGLTLYDQTSSPAGAGFASQLFEPANSAFDCRAADDFTVPAADIRWDIGGVQVLGAYISGTGPTPAINVEFFGAGGVPGGSVCSYPGLTAGVDYTDDGFGNLDITLPLVCSLTAGSYWVSVQADMDLAVGGQWVWGERSVGTDSPFAWENPPDGFGTGCVAWTPAGACGASDPDLLFALSGVAVPVELQSISID